MPQDQVKSAIAFTSFGGLTTNGDARDISLGAVRMENLSLVVPGQLTSRKGHSNVSFANGQADVLFDVIFMMRYESPSAGFVIYQLTDGSIRIGRTPT